MNSTLPAQSPAIRTPRNQFWAGVRAELPILVGVFPFGMIFGVLALQANMTPIAAQAMSSILFAGSAQFIAAQLIGNSVPALVIILTIAVVNLRHALYSASVAPYIQKLNPVWKGILAYLLTDEAYAVAITHYDKEGETPNGHWYFLGAGLALWTAWQISTAAGILLGAVIPSSWSLDFTLVLTFIALVWPTLKDRAAVAAALSAGVIAVLAYHLPYKLGLLAAAFVGILVGFWVEKRQ